MGPGPIVINGVTWGVTGVLTPTSLVSLPYLVGGHLVGVTHPNHWFKIVQKPTWLKKHVKNQYQTNCWFAGFHKFYKPSPVSEIKKKQIFLHRHGQIPKPELRGFGGVLGLFRRVGCYNLPKWNTNPKDQYGSTGLVYLPTFHYDKYR